MARTRNSSAEPERRARSVSRQPAETAPGRTRASASPAPSTMARKTSSRRDQPTPARQQIASTRASPPQRQQTKRVAKKTGRAGSKRGESLESDGRRSSAGSENGGVSIVGEEEVRRGLHSALPRVVEDDEESVSETLPSKQLQQQQQQQRQRQQQRAYSPSGLLLNKSDSPSRFSTPGFEAGTATGTQIEADDLDMDIILETFPDLDSNAQKLLDLLILNPPVDDLIRDLRIPGSKASKRLHLYEQSFNASKNAYGTTQYLSTRVVGRALETGTDILNPLLYKANLAVLAKFTHTAQETSDSTFQALKEVERSFPGLFGDVVHEGNFEAALEVRTQTLILGMKNQQATNLDPDTFLQHFFMQADSDQDAGTPGNIMDLRVKPWEGMKPVEGWENRVVDRIARIRSTFGRGEDEEAVDFDELMKLFPWSRFVNRMVDYIETRLAEIKEDRGSMSVADLVDAARDAIAMSALEGVTTEKGKGVSREEDEREVPESVQGRSSGTQTPEADVEQLPTPEENEEVGYPQLPALPQVAETAREELDRIREIEELRDLKRQIARRERELESIAFNTAQIRELKRRKTESFLQKKSEVQSTPRMATSLGTQDAVGINIAQMKLLKNMKSQLKPKPSQPKPQQQAPQDDGDYPNEDNRHHISDDEDLDPSQEPPTSTAREIFEQLKALKKDKNKENDKALALMLPPPISPPRGMKRKRFLDHQDGATKVSQISDDVLGYESPSKRQQVEKGKGRPLPSVEDEEQQQQQQAKARKDNPEPRPVDKGKGRAPPPVEHEEEPVQPLFLDNGSNGDESEQEDDEQEFVPDTRAENEERVKKSRRDISTGSASASHSVPARVSGSSRASNPSVRRPSNQSNQSEQSNQAQRQIVRLPGSRRDAPIDIDELDGSEADVGESDVARINRIAKANFIRDLGPRRQLGRQQKKTWGFKESELLIQRIGELGCRWAAIRDMKEPMFHGRSDVQLKDKARNLKFDYLKARVPLPLNFEDVTISRKQLDILEGMGIRLDDSVPEIDEDSDAQ